MDDREAWMPEDANGGAVPEDQQVAAPWPRVGLIGGGIKRSMADPGVTLDEMSEPVRPPPER